MGSEDCEEYAFYLLIPLYKACEGFMGKIVGGKLHFTQLVAIYFISFF